MSYVRKPHPSLIDYDVVTLDTKVHHELLVRKDVSEDDLIQLIVDYLLQYENVYRDTEDVNVWISLIKKLPSSTGGEDEVLA
jgi:hypothetical protein